MAAETNDLEVQQAHIGDPIEAIPVVRQHLHEVLFALNDAGTLSGSLDLLDSIRSPKVRQKSPLTLRLERLEQLLEGYLGLIEPLEGDRPYGDGTRGD